MNRHLAVAAALRAAACYIDWETGDPKSLLLAISDELVDPFERIRLSEIEKTDNKFKSQ